MKPNALAIIAFLVLMAACSAPMETRTPIYVWQSINSHINPDTLQASFHEWKGHGVTGVCIECKDLDLIRDLSARAHAEGLEYHAWVPSMMRKDMPHEWYAVNRLGQSSDQHPSYIDSYRFLDPANPDVQAFLEEKYLEVARIPDVDYVRLDFIRYPDVILPHALSEIYGTDNDQGEYAPADYCYCDNCARTFMEQTGIDIRNVEDPSTVFQWAQFRCDQITLFVDRMARAVHQVGKKVSVDVFPGPISYAERMVRQQWNQWTVDMFFPMNYNAYYDEGLDWLSTVVSEEVEAAGHIPVMSGLRICQDWEHRDKYTHPKDGGLLPSELGTAVKNSLKAGASGICLLSAYRMTPEHWAALEEALK